MVWNVSCNQVSLNLIHRLYKVSHCLCTVQEVVRASILTNQIPRAQAALRRRGQEEHRLSALRMEGLRQVYSCLQRRDLETANTLLTNMVRTQHYIEIKEALLVSNKARMSQRFWVFRIVLSHLWQTLVIFLHNISNFIKPIILAMSCHYSFMKSEYNVVCCQGFSVKKQLHSICQYTDDKDLREFVVSQTFPSDTLFTRVHFKATWSYLTPNLHK